MSRKRAITTFLSRKSMITRLSIAFKDFLGSSISPQVMPPWFEVKQKLSLLNYFNRKHSQVMPSRALNNYVQELRLVRQSWVDKQMCKWEHILENCVNEEYNPSQSRCSLISQGATYLINLKIIKRCAGI